MDLNMSCTQLNYESTERIYGRIPHDPVKLNDIVHSTRERDKEGGGGNCEIESRQFIITNTKMGKIIHRKDHMHVLTPY